MSYTKTKWVNDEKPAINADNLNHIEEGIAAVTPTNLTAKDTPADGDLLLLDNSSGGTKSITYAKLKAAILAEYTKRHAGYKRKDITSRISELKTAIASGDPEAYGFHEGDYFTGASGYVYILADYDHWYGAYGNQAVVSTRHWGVIVNTKKTHAWNASGKTTGGYVASDLHAYLTGEVLTNVKSDMSALGLSLISSNRLYSTAITETQVNRYGTASGGASSWSWSNSQIIAAPTEAEIYGHIAWSSSGFDTGEGYKPLRAFQIFRPNELLGNIYCWLRDIISTSAAAIVNGDGLATRNGVTYARYVLGLIGVY